MLLQLSLTVTTNFKNKQHPVVQSICDSTLTLYQLTTNPEIQITSMSVKMIQKSQQLKGNDKLPAAGDI